MPDVSRQLRSQDNLKRNLIKTYVTIAVATVILGTCLAYVYWASDEMVARQAPQAKAMVQLQLDASLAHLWFEEMISEDSNISLDQVMSHLDRAQTCLRALLQGGESHVGEIVRLKDEQTRTHLEQVQSQLTTFRRITLERWDNQATSGIGSSIDRTHDRVFQGLLDTTSTVQDDLSALSQRQLKTLKTIQLSLIGVCVVTAASLGGIMTRLLLRHIRDREALLAANQQLEASNEQLHASEQQLRATNQQLEATNQQLHASDQQLRATNQQLEASDQQMRAVNQQLISSEQQVRIERDQAQRYFSLAGTILVVLDTDGKIERINEKGREIIAATEQEIVGKDWFRCFLPEPMQSPVRHVFDQMISGEVEPVEFYENPIQTAQGEERLIAWHNTIVRDEEGRVVSVLSSGEDITERKKAEKEIRLFKQALDSSSDAIGMSTPEGRHIYQNQTFDELFGCIGDDPPATVYVNEDVGREIFATIMNGDGWAGEVSMYGKNKTVLTALLRAYPVKEDGQVIALVGAHTDITERIQAETSLRESQQRLHQLIDAAPYGALEYELHPDDRLVFVGYNQAANRILDVECAQFMGKTIEEAFPPLAETPIPEAYRRTAATVERYEDEQVIYSHDQITGAFEISAFQTGPQRMAVFFRDITERKRATVALENERNLIVRLMETSPVGIVMTDESGQIQFANSPAEQILGLEMDKIVGRAYNDVDWRITDYDGNPFPNEQLPFSQVMNKLRPVHDIRHAVEWSGGGRTLLSINAAPLLDQEGQFTGMVGSVEDVTERVQAEKKVFQYQSQLRALVSQLTLSEERERKRLAVELHDGICQSLAMAKLKVDEQLVNDSPSGIHGLLEEMQQTLEGIINDTRSLTNNLGTPMLQQMGLHVALEKWLDTEISAKHDIKTEVIDEGVPKTLNDDTKALLFRAVRELATNVVKHAQANSLTVTLKTRENELSLAITDDGKGFTRPVLSEQDFRQGGYGLFSIYERITYIGGSMTIDTSPGKGTEILLCAPLARQSKTNSQAM